MGFSFIASGPSVTAEMTRHSVGAQRLKRPGSTPSLMAPAEVAALLAARMPELIHAVLQLEPTSKNTHEWRCRGRGSLSIHVAGPRRGRFYDYEAGVCGDALAFIAHVLRLSMKEAYYWALTWLGHSRSSNTFTLTSKRISEMPAIRQRTPVRPTIWWSIWQDAAPAEDSPVEVYLTSRGLLLPTDAPLRFHPACPRGRERCPAMIALMTDPIDGEPCGVHRTFLLPDGTGKALGQAKMMLGAAGVIRLVPDEKVTLGLGLAEGIETSLMVMQHYDWCPVWAAGSAGGIARFPVLNGIESLTIFADSDDGGAGLYAAQQCLERWCAAGREGWLIPAAAGFDHADLRQGVV